MTPDRELARSGNGTHLAIDPWSGRPASGGSLGAPAPQPSPAKKLNRLLRGRWGWAVGLAAAGMLAGAAAGYKFSHPRYRSDGLIQIQPALMSLSKDREAVMPMYEAYMQTQVSIILSQRVIEAAMSSDLWKSVGRGMSPAAEKDFIDALDVSHMDGTFFIRVAFSDPDPQIAAKAVQSMIGAYQGVWEDVDTQQAESKIAILRRQRDQEKGSVIALQGQILDRARKYGNEDLGPLQEAKSREMTEWEMKLHQAEVSLAAAQAAVGAAGDSPATQPANSVAHWSSEQIARVDAIMARYLADLEGAESRLDQLKAQGLMEANSAVRKAQADVKLAGERVEAYAERFRKNNAGIQVTPEQLGGVALTADSVKQLAQQVQTFTKLYQNARDAQVEIGRDYIEIRKLQDELQQHRELADQYSKAIDEATADLQLSSRGRLKVVTAGDVPVVPAIDKRKQAAGVGALLGAGLPLGFLLLLGLLDQRYRFSDDASEEQHGIALLGILPNLPDLLTDPRQAQIAAHCVHQVRTMLQIRVNASDGHIFTITSAAPGDGKTSMTLALGLSFAASGSRTLLVDCDLVGGALSRRLRVDRPEGILEAMADGKAMNHVVDADVENLSVLPVGSAGLVHAGSFSPSALRRVLSDARKNFDVVLVDTGPILGSIEAAAVAAQSDGVVLVVSRGQQRPLVERSVAQLRAIGAHLAGIVFNRAETHDFERSVSRFSVRSTRPGDEAGGNGTSPAAASSHSHTGGAYGPVAGAVASSFRPGDRS